jgi:hypothetical protein
MTKLAEENDIYRIIIEIKSHCGSPVDQDIIARIDNVARGNGCIIYQSTDSQQNVMLKIKGHIRKLKIIQTVLQKNNLPTGEIT